MLVTALYLSIILVEDGGLGLTTGLIAALIGGAAALLLAGALLSRTRGTLSMLAAGWAILCMWGLLGIFTIGAPLLLGAVPAGVSLWRRAASEELLGLAALVSVWTAILSIVAVVAI